ncbi:phage tail sheath subtilisin-like domain-containing protein [Phenylobacterium sp.]|uniref:phage tail sheath family protein n=1 Tax=Phenylobacterium sp. TaxID=1871053 RepID=UPI00301C704B
MPTYRAPGVFVEETSFRTRTVTPAPSGVTAFVGPTLAAPDDPQALPALRSFTDFERHYGDASDLAGPDGPVTNYLAHAARAFFDNGGGVLHVAPVAPGDTSAQACEAALARLDAEPDIELVAAPAAAAGPDDTPHRIASALVAHVEAAGRHRFAVLDPPPGLSIAQVRAFRAPYDSRRAALYYPWVEIAAPAPPGEAQGQGEIQGQAAPSGRLALPPSGFVCGAYAATDVERGLWIAPANRVAKGVTGLQAEVNADGQDLLNPLGVNCIRRLSGRGIRIWGARTLSSDPEFRYVNVRRLVAHVEASLARNLAWTAIEPSAPALWTNVAAMTRDFLVELWRAGALHGDSPDKAFFVRCGSDTMSPADVADGRLVVSLGLAVVRPAEFIVLRIVAAAQPAGPPAGRVAGPPTGPAPSGSRGRRQR